MVASQPIHPCTRRGLLVGPAALASNSMPEDLFTANYSTFSAPVPGWNTGPSQGRGSNMQYFGLNMQYNVPAPVPTYTQPPISSNPFDFNSEPTPAQASPFPSLLPLQAWMPHQYSHQIGMSSHAQTYGSSVAPNFVLQALKNHWKNTPPN
ncbi:hypothetical protein ACET3Z_022493 [Daucus carota]